MSDFAACYGLPAGYLDPPRWWQRLWAWLRGVPLESRYIRWFRLILNIDRQRMALAVAVARGVVAAEPQPLGEEWADAIATDASEVESILSRTNSQRAAARARARSMPYG